MNLHEYGWEFNPITEKYVKAWSQIFSSHAFQPENHKTKEMNTIV